MGNRKFQRQSVFLFLIIVYVDLSIGKELQKVLDLLGSLYVQHVLLGLGIASLELEDRVRWDKKGYTILLRINSPIIEFRLHIS